MMELGKQISYNKFRSIQDNGRLTQFSQTQLILQDGTTKGIEIYYEPEKNRMWIESFSNQNFVWRFDSDPDLEIILKTVFYLNNDQNFTECKTILHGEIFLEDATVQGQPILKMSLKSIRDVYPLYQMDLKI
jgi:hypothetical protein